MDLRSLNIFIQVAELGSFTRAGEKLGYSQPTISFQIKQLERELNVQLFERIGHTVSLTEDGGTALVHAQQICRIHQEMVSGPDHSREAQGVIRLATADSLCMPVVARRFGEFRATYPNVALNVSTGSTSHLFRLLDHNEVDLICTMDIQVFDTTYVIASEEKVGIHFVASAHSPLSQLKKLTVPDLLEYPFLLTEKGMSYRRLLDERLAHDGLQIQPILEAGSADLLCRLVEQNLGISFLPDYVTDQAVQAGTIVRLPIKNFDIGLWKQLIYRRDKWVSLPLQAVVAHLSKILLET